MAMIERRDTATLEQWDPDTRIYRRYEDGVLVEERAFTDAECAVADERIAAEQARALEDARTATADQLRQQARTALSNNQNYLATVAAGTATTATHIAQVPALTRQMQAVIRLLVGSDLLDPPTTPPAA